MEEKRETIGKLSHDLLYKDDQVHLIDQQRAMQENYEENVIKACEDFKKSNPHTDFFVVVLTKKERLMMNVLRHYYFARFSCPTPEWDQAVYTYSWVDDCLSFLWVVPSKDTCKFLKDTALELQADERDLLNFVLDFEDGTLLAIAKGYNNEKAHSPLLDT